MTSDERAILNDVADLIDLGRPHIDETIDLYFRTKNSPTSRAAGCAIGAGYVGACLRLGQDLETILTTNIGFRRSSDVCRSTIVKALGLSETTIASTLVDIADLVDPGIVLTAGFPAPKESPDRIQPVLAAIDRVHTGFGAKIPQIVDRLRAVARREDTIVAEVSEPVAI